MTRPMSKLRPLYLCSGRTYDSRNTRYCPSSLRVLSHKLSYTRLHIHKRSENRDTSLHSADTHRNLAPFLTGRLDANDRRPHRLELCIRSARELQREPTKYDCECNLHICDRETLPEAPGQSQPS
jgi:hypothetical protein